jgi:hypothetical protein
MEVDAAATTLGGDVASPSPVSLLCGLAALLVLWAVSRAAERCWLRPRRVSRALRAQGLGGTVYRFPAGDLAETGRLNEEARSKPMPPSHDIVPRVAPHLHSTVKEHGMRILFFGEVEFLPGRIWRCLVGGVVSRRQVYCVLKCLYITTIALYYLTKSVNEDDLILLLCYNLDFAFRCLKAVRIVDS